MMEIITVWARQQPASRCCSAALCKPKAASPVCHWPICSSHTDHENDTTPTTRAYTHDSPGFQIMQVEWPMTLTHRPVCVYAAKSKQFSYQRHRGSRCLGRSSISARVQSAGLGSIFKLSSTRVASFCASVPPCCSPTLRRSTTSDVGSSSSAAQETKTSRGSTLTLVCTYTAASGRLY